MSENDTTTINADEVYETRERWYNRPIGSYIGLNSDEDVMRVSEQVAVGGFGIGAAALLAPAAPLIGAGVAVGTVATVARNHRRNRRDRQIEQG